MAGKPHGGPRPSADSAIPGGANDAGLLIYERLLPAVPDSVARIRWELIASLRWHQLAEDRAQDIALVVSEALTNTVLHAYRDSAPGPLYVSAALLADTLTISVCDYGSGLHTRADSPGLGVGIALMTQLSDTLQVSRDASGKGTCVDATFDDIAPARSNARRAGAVPESDRAAMVGEYLRVLRSAKISLEQETDAVHAQAHQVVTRARRQRRERLERTRRR